MTSFMMGHIISVPYRIEPDQIDAAVLHVLERWRPLLDAPLTTDDPDWDDLPEGIKWNDYTSHQRPDLLSLVGKTEAEVREMVREVADFCSRPSSASDTTWREDPHDLDRRLLFAGDWCHGAPPEGHGYRMIERAYLLEIDEIFGIL